MFEDVAFSQIPISDIKFRTFLCSPKGQHRGQEYFNIALVLEDE